MSGFDILDGISRGTPGGLKLPDVPKLDGPLIGEPGAKNPIAGGEPSSGGSFASALEGALGRVRQLQQESTANYEALGRGEDVELHDVMMAMGKSEVAFNLMLEIRNKILEAWQQLSRSVT